MKITQNFYLNEFTRSYTADKLGIRNIPDPNHQSNIIILVNKLIQPIRDILTGYRGQDTPITIQSGYRSKELNEKVGGVSDSQHLKGQACDFVVHSMELKEVFEIIIASGLQFDQIILEPSWIHISYSNNNRNQKLIAYKKDQRMIYKRY